MARTCPISVYTDQSQTHIGFIKPTQMLTALSDNPSLLHIFENVHSSRIQMDEEAK